MKDKNNSVLAKQIVKFHKWFDRFEQEEISHINENVIVQQAGPGNTFDVINIFTNPSAWQKIDGELVTALNPPLAGTIKTTKTEAKPHLKRILIGYQAVLNCKSYKQFKYLMQPILIQAKEEVELITGFDYIYDSVGETYLTFRQGKNKTVFRDSQEAAAIELRAYSNCLQTYNIK